MLDTILCSLKLNGTFDVKYCVPTKFPVTKQAWYNRPLGADLRYVTLHYLSIALLGEIFSSVIR